MAEQEALRFIDAFPEALTFNVTVLSADKSIKFVHLSQCSRRLLLDKLTSWLSMRPTHFFIRPIMNNLIMIDLDEYRGGFDIITRLQPRRWTRRFQCGSSSK